MVLYAIILLVMDWMIDWLVGWLMNHEGYPAFGVGCASFSFVSLHTHVWQRGMNAEARTPVPMYECFAKAFQLGKNIVNETDSFLVLHGRRPCRAVPCYVMSCRSMPSVLMNLLFVLHIKRKTMATTAAATTTTAWKRPRGRQMFNNTLLQLL